MSENKYPIGGYAPGNYHNRCCTCERSFFGDKRAVQCEPCALASLEKFNALLPAEQEEVLKRNIEIWNRMFDNMGKTTDIKQKIFNILLNYTYANRTKAADELTKLFEQEIKLYEGGYAPLPADDAVQNWFEENIDKECSASSAIYKFRLWLNSMQIKPTGAVSPILADIIRFKAGAAEYFMQHNCRELYGVIQTIIQLAEDGIKTSGPVWYTEKEMYNYLRQSNYSIDIANELAKDWAISFQGAYEKGRQHAVQQPAGAVWIKDALQWSKEAIEFANKEFECPQSLIETWGNLYMNVLHAIDQALDEVPTFNHDHITAALRKFVSMHETGLLPNRFTYEEGKKALEGIGEIANNETPGVKALYDALTYIYGALIDPVTAKRCSTQMLNKANQAICMYEKELKNQQSKTNK